MVCWVRSTTFLLLGGARPSALSNYKSCYKYDSDSASCPACSLRLSLPHMLMLSPQAACSLHWPLPMHLLRAAQQPLSFSLHLSR